MRTLFEIIAALQLPMPRGVLQVGASSGQEIDYFRANGIVHAALIEPLPAPFAQLSVRCAEVGYLAVQALCGEIDGEEVDFFVASNNGESSSILRPARHLRDFPWVSFPQTLRMSTFTLDRILATIRAHHLDLAQAIDLLYMDVQGAELRVLQGANATLHQVRYIYTEVGIGGGYEDDVELLKLAQFLRVYGFRLYELETDSTGWGNAFFINFNY
jgi:FkbM family methyltransferase